jgi:hypothetical protein
VASEDEDIEVVEIDADAAFRALESGDIQDAKTIIALQWLRLHGDRLWGEHGRDVPPARRRSGEGSA